MDPRYVFEGVVSAQKNFVAQDHDIILTSCPKSGTTWLKALVFAIVNRTHEDFSLTNSPLLKQNPHDLVPLLEDDSLAQFQSLTGEADPRVRRLVNTHLPYESLPPSIKASGSKILYICRNPMDQFISMWHFSANYPGGSGEPCRLEECFDRFCHGIHEFGPFWKHGLEFWKASLEKPQKVLFLKYEDLKKDPFQNIKRLADFLGLSFSEEERKKGVIEEIMALCSIGSMKNLEVNKNGWRPKGIPHKAFFRKGEVGDSKNFLTPAMAEQMEKLMREKFGEHYLAFKLSV